MSEVDQRRIDNLIDEWREAGTRNPVGIRLRHMNTSEIESYLASEGAEVPREDCTCYWHGFVSMSRAQKEQIKREHIAAGRHEFPCPMAETANPMYSRPGDTVPPSYTRQQRNRDEDNERVDYTPARRFRLDD